MNPMYKRVKDTQFFIQALLHYRLLAFAQASNSKEVANAPVLLAAAGAIVLPLVVVLGEEDNLVAQGLLDAGDGDLLVEHGRDVDTVGVARGWVTALEDITGLATAGLLDILDLALDELAGVGGQDIGAEVGVDVGSHNIDGITHNGLDILLLPSADDIGGRVGAGVVGQLTLDVGDEVDQLLGGTVAVVQGLVSDCHELNKVPLAPLLESRDLGVDIRRAVGATVLANEDTDDHLHAVLLAGVTNERQGVTVGGVHTQCREAGVGDGLDVGVNGIRALALAVLRVVRRVGHSPQVSAATEASSRRGGSGARGRRGRSRRGHGDEGRRGGRDRGLGAGGRRHGAGDGRNNGAGDRGNDNA